MDIVRQTIHNVHTFRMTYDMEVESMKTVLISVFASFAALIILVIPCFARIDPATAVGIYLFDEEKANEITDHSGKGHVGTFQGGGGKWDDGKFGSAINIAGGWIRIESADDLHPAEEWSVLAWINVENIGPNNANAIVTKWNEYLLRVDKPAEGGKISCFVKPGNNWEPRFKGVEPKIEEWMHVAMTWNNKDNGALKLYIDGVNIGQGARQGKIPSGENPLCIGSRTGASIFSGLIDDVGVFNVALGDADIKSIMDNGLKAVMFGGISVDLKSRLAATWGELRSR